MATTAPESLTSKPPKMSSRQALQLRSTLKPYRENGVLKYMPAFPPNEQTPLPAQTTLPTDHLSTSSSPRPSTDAPSTTSSSTTTHPASLEALYSAHDSDCEPLLAFGTPQSHEYTPDASLDRDAYLRFTATGRPMTQFRPSAYANMSGSMYIAPQHLPQRYTDESVIPVVIKLNGGVKGVEKSGGVGTGVAAEGVDERRGSTSRRKSLLTKLKSSTDRSSNSSNSSNNSTSTIKVIYMPRGEYLKYFARDNKSVYIGTEPEREWTEAELEETYGKYTKFRA